MLMHIIPFVDRRVITTAITALINPEISMLSNGFASNKLVNVLESVGIKPTPEAIIMTGYILQYLTHKVKVCMEL